EVTFDDVEVFGTAVEQWQEDGDRVHRAPLFAEAVGVRTKVRFVDRVEDGTEGFLDDPVSEGWNPQRARLPVTLGNEYPAYRERFVRLRLQEAHDERDVLVEILPEGVARLAVDPGREAAGTRQNGLRGFFNPQPPVHEAVQVGEPVVGIVERRACQ